MTAIPIQDGRRGSVRNAQFCADLLKNAPNLLKKAIVSEAYGPMIEREVIDLIPDAAPSEVLYTR